MVPEDCRLGGCSRVLACSMQGLPSTFPPLADLSSGDQMAIVDYEYRLSEVVVRLVIEKAQTLCSLDGVSCQTRLILHPHLCRQVCGSCQALRWTGLSFYMLVDTV